jgi:hypothetical protein
MTQNNLNFRFSAAYIATQAGFRGFDPRAGNIGQGESPIIVLLARFHLHLYQRS